MSKRVTIGDVAKLAGVHAATVSRSLNERTEAQVNTETLRRVKKAAKQLGYVPNVVARGLRTSSSMTIGVIIPDLMNPIFPPMVRGIENYLQPRGYTALVANTDGQESIERALFESLTQRRVDGFILATGRLDDQPQLARAYDDGVFAVLVNRESGSAPYPVVMGDGESGIAAALHHVAELGHRRIVHIAGPTNYSTTRRRCEAFTATTATMPGVDASIFLASGLTAAAGETAMDEILAHPGPRPTAIVAGNDLVALGALRSIRSHGLRCPEDVSVVGFNDMPFAADFSPSLTTVRMPLRELGTEAARLLLVGIEAGRQDPVTLTMPVSLVVRDSTGPAPE